MVAQIREIRLELGREDPVVGRQPQQANAAGVGEWLAIVLLLAAGIVSFVLALASDTAWRGVAWLVLSETVAVAEALTGPAARLAAKPATMAIDAANPRFNAAIEEWRALRA